jgi:hypothetical protein
MNLCERCRSDEARCYPAGVHLCYGCASDLHVFDADHGLVGQEGSVEGGADSVQSHLNARGTSPQDAGRAIEKTADAAGQIAKTVKVCAVIVGVAGVAWVGYALYKARQEAVGLQHGAQQAFLAHPELLRI